MIRRKSVTAGLWLAIAALAFAPLAPAQSSHSQLWTSATSGTKYRVTMGDRRLLAEKIFPPEFQSQVDQGAFVGCEYSEQGDAWAGKCRSNLPLADSKN